MRGNIRTERELSQTVASFRSCDPFLGGFAVIAPAS